MAVTVTTLAQITRAPPAESGRNEPTASADRRQDDPQTPHRRGRMWHRRGPHLRHLGSGTRISRVELGRFDRPAALGEPLALPVLRGGLPSVADRSPHARPPRCRADPDHLHAERHVAPEHGETGEVRSDLAQALRVGGKQFSERIDAGSPFFAFEAAVDAPVAFLIRGSRRSCFRSNHAVGPSRAKRFRSSWESRTASSQVPGRGVKAQRFDRHEDLGSSRRLARWHLLVDLLHR